MSLNLGQQWTNVRGRRMIRHLMRFQTGLVIGKFYPPHVGHAYLIETALARCGHVTVIVCEGRDERPGADARASALASRYPDIAVIVAHPPWTLLDDDSAGWARLTMELLDHRHPEAVFTSEAYGPTYASHLDAEHVMVDRERTHVPVRGSTIRADIRGRWDEIIPEARHLYTLRIAIVGADSTGKTTLAEDLARHYGTTWVPEYARTYTDGLAHTTAPVAHWTADDFLHLQSAQVGLEERLLLRSNRVLLCDTTPECTALWMRRYLPEAHPEVDRAGVVHRSAYELHILV